MNKVALITGGTRGIGLGIAKSLAQEGWVLILNGMRPESSVEQVMVELRGEFDVDVSYVQGNISDSDERQRLISEAVECHGIIHALVNNAGVAPSARLDILETTEESYDRVMDINLKGPFFLSQAIAKKMVEWKKAQTAVLFSIVNIGSISATIASITRGEYCLSKAGMSMMTDLFAVRLGDSDIPVYEVRPGIIETDMTSGVKAKYDALIEDGLMVQRRWGQPEDVGKAVAAILRGDVAYSTGQVIMVDGGLTLNRL